MAVLTHPEAVALAVVGLARQERFAEVEASFAPRLRALVSAETLQADWQGQLARTGPVTEVGAPAQEQGLPGLVRVSVPVTCERGELSVVMSVDGAGNLHGLRLAAPAVAEWEPPPYAAPKRLTEQDITLGSGPLAVPGTLTLPLQHGRRPAAVLLGGGGPVDRDETSGVRKPLKDLAWGLASLGVVTVRFDKVTFAHPEAADEPGFTMTDEYVPHAVAAVRLLRGHYAVDPSRVFLLGHGAGGPVAPRVAAAEPVAGLVVLAGDGRPKWIDSAGLTPDTSIEVGPSTPDGHALPQHVDPAVVGEIAEWLAAARPG